MARQDDLRDLTVVEALQAINAKLDRIQADLSEALHGRDADEVEENVMACPDQPAFMAMRHLGHGVGDDDGPTAQPARDDGPPNRAVDTPWGLRRQ